MSVVSKLAAATSVPLLLLALLSPRSRAARKHLNTILYFTSMGLCSIYGIFLALTVWVVPGERLNIFYYVARAMHALTGLLTGTRVSVEGYENIDENRPAVLVGNHQSSLDILYLGAMFPKHTSIMAKKELKWVPFLGQWMNMSGAVWIDRKSRKDAITTFARIGERMHKDNLSLWIFPEGTRSKLPVPGLLPFKMGAFHLALQSGLPIIPVVCENYYPLYDDGKTRFEAGTIRLRILPAVETKGYTKETVHDLADKVHAMMLQELHRLDAQRDQEDLASIPVPNGETHPEKMLAAAQTAAQSRPQRSPRDQLGGVARAMSYIVGTGSGQDVQKQVQRQKEDLHKKGLGYGDSPADFGLVSSADQEKLNKAEGQQSTEAESDDKKSSEPAESTQIESSTTNATQRKNNSDDLVESAVLVDKPEGVRSKI